MLEVKLRGVLCVEVAVDLEGFTQHLPNLCEASIPLTTGTVRPELRGQELTKPRARPLADLLAPGPLEGPCVAWKR